MIESHGSEPARSRRHLKVLVDEELAEGLGAYARERQVSVSDAVRLLVREGIRPVAEDDGQPDYSVLPALAFANLIATEQVIRLQVHTHPDRDWMLKLPEEAAEAARKRLEEVELAMQLPGRRRRPWSEEPRGIFRFQGPRS